MYMYKYMIIYRFGIFMINHIVIFPQRENQGRTNDLIFGLKTFNFYLTVLRIPSLIYGVPV